MLCYLKTIPRLAKAPYGTLMSLHFLLSASLSENKSKAQTKWVICFCLCIHSMWKCGGVNYKNFTESWLITVCKQMNVIPGYRKAFTNKVKLAIRADSKVILEHCARIKKENILLMQSLTYWKKRHSAFSQPNRKRKELPVIHSKWINCKLVSEHRSLNIFCINALTPFPQRKRHSVSHSMTSK